MTELALPIVGADALLTCLREALDAMGGASKVALATDGDGTLWTSDVGEAFFEAVGRAGMIGATAHPALLIEAARHDVLLSSEDRAEPRRVALALYNAYLSGQFPEDSMCAVIAWCMAGTKLAELKVFATAMLERSFQLRDRFIPEAFAVLRWASALGIPMWLVSASPLPVVEAAACIAADAMGLPELQVLAFAPLVKEGVVQPDTFGVRPYGEGKRRALELALAPSGRGLLCALGDTVFDAAMLRAALVPIAIRPKRPMLEISASIPRLVHAREKTYGPFESLITHARAARAGHRSPVESRLATVLQNAWVYQSVDARSQARAHAMLDVRAPPQLRAPKATRV
ncbi:MAG: hypothetical protein NVS3B20_18040 [Polyangiales bacterium]